MSKRDYISEILSRRSRLKKRSPRIKQIEKRVLALYNLREFLTLPVKNKYFSRDEVAKYLPIGFVACIEGYFRLVFRDLIDYGSPFRENVTNFREIKFGVEHVVAIEGGKLSLGEFVSHFLPVNGIQDIDSSMSTLMAHSFLDQFKSMEVKEADMNEPKPLNDILAVDVMLKMTQRLFELRHIYSHELAPKEKVNVKEIRSCANWALLFLAYSEILVEQITNSGNSS